MSKNQMLTGRDLIREKVRQRDQFTCQLCGKIWENGQRRFDVHHTDEFEGKEGRKYRNNNVDSMVTLCHRCHLNNFYLYPIMKLNKRGMKISTELYRTTVCLPRDIYKQLKVKAASSEMTIAKIIYLLVLKFLYGKDKNSRKE